MFFALTGAVRDCAFRNESKPDMRRPCNWHREKKKKRR